MVFFLFFSPDNGSKYDSKNYVEDLFFVMGLLQNIILCTKLLIFLFYFILYVQVKTVFLLCGM